MSTHHALPEGLETFSRYAVWSPWLPLWFLMPPNGALTLFLMACVALIISWGGGHIDPTTLKALGGPKYVP